MDRLSDFIYFSAVLGLGILGWFLISSLLNRSERKKAERIQDLKRFEPVRSNAPGNNHTEKARASALERLGSRFSIIRRTLLTILVVVWLLLAFFPFLGGFPQSVLSLLGAGGAVLIGIAARPFLENVISGYVVTFSKQFRTGDTVLMDGQYGTIEDITPIHTVIKLWDWRRYVVPNSRMLTKEATHYSNREGLIWALLKFHVAFDADLDRVEEIAVGAARKSPVRTGEEDPKFWIMGMGRESMECWLAMWTRGPIDAWTIRVEVAGAIARQMAKEGIRSHSYEVRRDAPTPPPNHLGEEWPG
jgi:small-conductance mechanosensitive channel